jgi:hypothetical protein
MDKSRNAGRLRPVTSPDAVALLLLPLALAFSVGSGCDGESRHESVSGTVTLDGKTLDDGNIQFTPDGGDGLAVGSMVSNGRYNLPNPPGLPPGKYRVSIVASGSAAARPDRAPDVDIAIARTSGAPKPIPARYNAQTTLRAEVTAGGPNAFDFALSGKPDPATIKATGH